MNTPAAAADGCMVGDLGEDLVWAVRIISGALRRSADESVKDLPGGSRAYLVLTALADPENEPPTQLVLAAKVGVDRTVLTYLLDDLESRGLLTRRPNPRDRRARQVVLTPEGESRLAGIRERMAEEEDHLLSVLPPADALRLRSLLTQVAKQVQSDLWSPPAIGG